MDNVYIEQERLRWQLSSSIYKLDSFLNISTFDLIISVCEVNERHGTGIFLKRIFPDSSKIISFRSINNYDGQQDFGSHQLCFTCNDLSYPEVLLKIQEAFGKIRPKEFYPSPI